MIDFGSAADIAEFWGFVKTLLSAISPFMMIWAAIVAAAFLVGIVVKAWRDSSKDVENEDIDYREY